MWNNERVESISKLIILIGLVLYIVGLIVNSYYYSGLGIHKYDFFKPHYVLSGFWAILPILVIVSWFYPLRFTNKIIDYFFTPAFSLMLLGLLRGSFGHTFESVIPDLEIDTIVKLALVFFLLFLILIGAKLGIKFPWNIRTSLTIIVLFIVMSVTYIYSFSTIIFPTIPQALGGGKPEKVRLYLKKNVTEISIVKDSLGYASVFDLLLETDKYYAVANSNFRADLYDKSLFYKMEVVFEEREIYQRKRQALLLENTRQLDSLKKEQEKLIEVLTNITINEDSLDIPNLRKSFATLDSTRRRIRKSYDSLLQEIEALK